MSKFGTIRTDIKWSRIKLNEDSLLGKKVAVIGGTNGIGRAIALEFVAKGAFYKNYEHKKASTLL